MSSEITIPLANSMATQTSDMAATKWPTFPLHSPNLSLSYTYLGTVTGPSAFSLTLEL